MRDIIKLGMARAFFCSAWADQANECGHQFAPGTELTDAMPQELEPAAYHAADTLIFDMERANGCPISDQWDETTRGNVDASELREKPELWGHYAAMQAMGHGVGLGDYGIGEDMVRVPYVEFGSHSLARDYF